MSVATGQGESPFAASDAAVPPGLWERVDRWVERGGEKLNPILVKEARQSLKSRQFLVTFTLLLICGWTWSMIGIAVMTPGVYYAPAGPFMLIGYYIVLSVPLMLIVPFTAYRSLAGEREDGTYELLSITSLNSRQIVSGKLGSAVLQMLVYYSALSPCIAFTYLLRGIDIVTICMFLAYSFLSSLLLTVVGLMVATITRSRQIQLLLSVALLIGLVFYTFVWCIYTAVAFFELGALPFDEADFWIGHLAFLTAFASFFVLMLVAAAAQLSFASDNRSTKLRIIMLTQQVLYIGWFIYFWLRVEEEEIGYVMITMAAIYWVVMGALMTGEYAELSPRVRRSLPQSFLGRMRSTWFNPGSGTGYVFAVLNLTVLVLVAFGAGIYADIAGTGGSPDAPEFYLFGVLTVAYVTAYLGIGRLLVLLFRRYLYFGLLLPFLLHMILISVGAAFPAFLQAFLNGFDDFQDYTILQATNWFWTLIEAADDGATGEVVAVTVLTVGTAIGVFLINLIFAIREVEQTRQETPDRVLEDEVTLHPERIATKKPSSPWDE